MHSHSQQLKSGCWRLKTLVKRSITALVARKDMWLVCWRMISDSAMDLHGITSPATYFMKDGRKLHFIANVNKSPSTSVMTNVFTTFQRHYNPSSHCWTWQYIDVTHVSSSLMKLWHCAAFPPRVICIFTNEICSLLINFIFKAESNT